VVTGLSYLISFFVCRVVRFRHYLPADPSTLVLPSNKKVRGPLARCIVKRSLGALGVDGTSG